MTAEIATMFKTDKPVPGEEDCKRILQDEVL